MSDRGPESTKAREHLANERTLLAWVRTAITFMGLGFVVARFGLFLKQLALESHASPPAETALSGVVGIALVALGTLATILSAARFLRARAQIEKGAFVPEIYAELFVVAATLLGGLALIAYLAASG
jgi:putative membrane protein